MSTTNNRSFAENDQNFRTACELSNVKPTKRQASKFLNKRGTAYKVGLPKMKNAEAK